MVIFTDHRLSTLAYPILERMLNALTSSETLENAQIRANLLVAKAMIVARFGAIQLIDVCNEV